MCDSSRVPEGTGVNPPNTGKMLSAVPFPALSMTKSTQAAHDHFRMQGQRRADGESGRAARVSSWLSTQAGGFTQPGPGPQALASLPEKVPPPPSKKPGKTNFWLKKKKASITHPPHKYQLRTHYMPRTVSSNKKNTHRASALQVIAIFPLEEKERSGE